MEFVLRRLPDVVNIRLGKKTRNSKNSSDYEDAGKSKQPLFPCPYLSASSITIDGNIILDEKKIMLVSADEQEKYSLRAGDLLVVEGGKSGRTALLRHDIPGYVFQNTLIRLRPKDAHEIARLRARDVPLLTVDIPYTHRFIYNLSDSSGLYQDIVLPEYLHYFFRFLLSDGYIKQLRQRHNYRTFNHLTLSSLKEIIIQFPPLLTDQITIISFLNALIPVVEKAINDGLNIVNHLAQTRDMLLRHVMEHPTSQSFDRLLEAISSINACYEEQNINQLELPLSWDTTKQPLEGKYRSMYTSSFEMFSSKTIEVVLSMVSDVVNNIVVETQSNWYGVYPDPSTYLDLVASDTVRTLLATSD